MDRDRTQHNVILGAGAMGTAAAYHLAMRGEAVLLLDQFPFGHARGSSHGAARIIRHSYADPRYARLMPAAFRAWRELEADAGVSLVVRTGGASFCPSGVPYVAEVEASLREIDIPHRRMSGEEWGWLHPPFALPPDYDVVFEPDAGLVAAKLALDAMLDRAAHHGAGAVQFLPETEVLRIDVESDPPAVVTESRTIRADRLIVTAGAWVGRLLPRYASRLVPTHQQVLYFRPGDPAAFELGRFPVFIFMGEGEGQAFYGMPGFLGTSVKVARHGGPPVDPDDPRRAVDDRYREEVRAFLRAHIPVLSDAPIDREEVCLYTMAPEEAFVVGPLPDRPKVIVASPCSGHGFKFAPLVGRVLADLATRGTTEIDTTGWRTPANPEALGGWPAPGG